MERLTIWADMGLDDWEQTCYRVPFDPEGAYNILDLAFHYGQDGDAECANILQDISIRLKAYEDIGPTPEQLLEIDKMYLEMCREVAELRAELKAYKDTGMTPEDTLDMIACMDKEDGYGPEEEIKDLLELMRYRKAIGELEDKLERYHYLWHSLNDNSPYNAGRADAMRKAINILKGGAEDETD